MTKKGSSIERVDQSLSQSFWQVLFLHNNSPGPSVAGIQDPGAIVGKPWKKQYMVHADCTLSQVDREI